MSRKNHDAVLRLLADLAVNGFTVKLSSGGDPSANASICGSISIDCLDELVRLEYGCQIGGKK